MASSVVSAATPMTSHQRRRAASAIRRGRRTSSCVGTMTTWRLRNPVEGNLTRIAADYPTHGSSSAVRDRSGGQQSVSDGVLAPNGATDWPGRVLLVGSSGGHLAQLLALRSWWADRNRVWVTFPLSDARSQLAGEEVVWAHHPTTRNLRN